MEKLSVCVWDKKKKKWRVEWNLRLKYFETEAEAKRWLEMMKGRERKKEKEDGVKRINELKKETGVVDVYINRNSNSVHELKNFVFKAILDGIPKSELVKKLELDFKVSFDLTQYLYHNIMKEIAGVVAKEKTNIVELHVERYEWLYRKFRELGSEAWGVKVLQLKEKLYLFFL